ncbi:3-hydroxybutyrate oligomer hydrolase family protein [Pseudofulvimonas gallinarii]|nr:3-hydroxybutyrate oligomer hydrolase family protein [Pseudofulvimonas gallinarii]
MFGPVRETGHRGADDLLSAGLGLGGLRSPAPAFADPLAPTPAELRRRAIHANWNGIADLGPLGGFGSVYGAVPNVPGREFTAFARLPGASQPFYTRASRARCTRAAPRTTSPRRRSSRSSSTSTTSIRPASSAPRRSHTRRRSASAGWRSASSRTPIRSRYASATRTGKSCGGTRSPAATTFATAGTSTGANGSTSTTRR